MATERVELRDGSAVFIRAIRPGDKQALADGFARLSERSRYRRFLSPVSELRPRELRYFTEVDHHDHEALVAATSEGAPLGVARYVRTDEHTAEAAVAVVDAWQGRGLGTALLQRLAGRAAEEGIDTFDAVMLASNKDMLALLEELGSTELHNAGDGVVQARVKLPVATEPGAPLRRALREAAAGELETPPEEIVRSIRDT